ncbi:MAG TPA: response regulator [Firmicutes bacterium]|nr:response regulator [Bacillota bacterium]
MPRHCLSAVIADDDPIIRIDLRQMLNDVGIYVCGEAGDGVTAMAMVETTRPDVVILDVKMPRVDGVEAASKILESKLCAVILLTAYSDQVILERAVLCGVHGYLVKPVKPDDLLPTIRVAIANFRKARALEEKVTAIAAKLELRKLVERAKGLLMSQTGCSEEEAMRMLQKSSMDTRQSMREIARSVILSYGLLTSTAHGGSQQTAQPAAATPPRTGK